MSRLSIVAALAAAKRERQERAFARAPRAAGDWSRRPVRSGQAATNAIMARACDPSKGAARKVRPSELRR